MGIQLPVSRYGLATPLEDDVVSCALRQTAARIVRDAVAGRDADSRPIRTEGTGIGARDGHACGTGTRNGDAGAKQQTENTNERDDAHNSPHGDKLLVHTPHQEQFQRTEYLNPSLGKRELQSHDLFGGVCNAPCIGAQWPFNGYSILCYVSYSWNGPTWNGYRPQSGWALARHERISRQGCAMTGFGVEDQGLCLIRPTPQYTTQYTTPHWRAASSPAPSEPDLVWRSQSGPNAGPDVRMRQSKNHKKVYKGYRAGVK